MTQSLISCLKRVRLFAFAIGVLACAVSIVGWVRSPQQFFFSYLFAAVFWVGLSLGCFGVAMIHYLAGGRWGFPIRRILEAGFTTLPLMLVLFVPLFFGLHYLYPCARPGELTDKTLQDRQLYDSVSVFVIRQVFFFLTWIFIATRLRKWSLAQDHTADALPTCRMRTFSGPGLVIYGLLGTFASVDWIMSLEAHWHSSIFGVIVLIGQILTAFAFSTFVLTLFRNEPPYATTVTPTHYHHLGNLLLTFVLFWTYISFGQLLIIYSGDLPRELEWYIHRIAGSWKTVVALIAAFHFFVPFFLLLFRAVKKNVTILAALAAVLFVMHIVDTYWLVMPTLHPHGVSLSWLDFSTFLGIGGLWAGVFLFQLMAAPLLPQQDPGLQFSFVYAKPQS